MYSRLSSVARFVLVFLLILPFSSYSANLVVSIKPFYNIAAAVLDQVGTPILLLENDASPHDYALKPSDMQKLLGADLVIWYGHDLETALDKVISKLPGQNPGQNPGQKKSVLAISELKNLKTLSTRYDTNWHSHDHDHDHDHDHGSHHGHSHGSIDPHVWLSPANANIIATEIAEKLSIIDPKNKNKYQENLNKFINKNLELAQDLKRQLAPVNDLPYIVFHDGYQYFENYFNLNPLGSISLHPEIPPSAKRIAQIQTMLKQQQLACIFSEPQFKPKIINALVDGIDIKSGQLDPLGRDQDMGPDGYFSLLSNLANNLLQCQ